MPSGDQSDDSFRALKQFRSASSKLKNSRKLFLDDQKDALKNFVKIVAEGRMSLASLQFKQLCSLVRSQLSEQEQKAKEGINDRKV